MSRWKAAWLRLRLDRFGREMSWTRATVVAAAWALALTALSIRLYYIDESNDSWHYHSRLNGWVTLAFLAVGVLAGLLHRSAKVSWMFALFGGVGWLVGLGYHAWAYNNIGGGP